MDVDINIGPLIAYFLVGISTLLVLYWYTTKNHDYWKKRGVRFIKPFPVIGSLYDIFSSSVQDVERARYEKNGELYGYFEGSRPVLSVGDPSLLRGVLLKDFFSFTARRKFPSADKMLSNMVSVLEGEDWKRVRSIISPTFSTGKLKRVLSIFKDCAMTVVQNFKGAAEKKESFDVKRLYGAFTMDIIASAAFSMKIDSHNDPENVFVQNARTVFSSSLNWRFVIFFLAPKLAKLFRIPLFPGKPLQFFKQATLEVIEQRKKSGQIGNDFLQLLLDTAKEVSHEENWESQDKDKDDIASNYAEDSSTEQVFKSVKNKRLSTDELIAQCVMFFVAGYETTAATLAYASYLLALNPEKQEKLRQEVDETLAEYDGEFTYEAVQKMKYLDNVISETLRIYPPGVRLERVADSDYELGETGITVPKGMIVSVPVYGLHMDPKYFPDPEKFEPDRFNVEERTKRSPYVYLPFGAGPRNCVGMRFALLEIKVCLALVIAHYVIKRSPKTKVPLDFMKGQGFFIAKEVTLEMEKRASSPMK